MKHSRKDVRTKATAIPELRFEDQRLTSFAGRATLFMQLVVRLLLGFRELRDAAHDQDDPLVQRVLELKRLPDVTTLSRMLKEADQQSINKLRPLLADMVLERLRSLGLPRITLDFDGSVQSTKRRAEGTAVGFNQKKKGARSYYPPFCTIS